MFRYLVFSFFITKLLMTFHGLQSEASSIHFLSTDILKEVEGMYCAYCIEIFDKWYVSYHTD